jgi:protein-S-isoprenylcysteine O-methyltransferase Ste14
MALREHFESSGNFLFNWRSFVPLVLFPLIVAAMYFSNDFSPIYALSSSWKLLCVGVGLFGALIRALVIGIVPKNTSGRNTEGQLADTVNTTGIYSVVRHPLYVGNYFMMLAIVMWCGIAWCVLVFTLLFWLYYERIMFAEEEFLRKKFGLQYEEWAQRTPAWIPSFRHYAPAQLTFSIKNILRREYPGLLNMILSFVIVEALYEYLIAPVRGFPHYGIADGWWFALAGSAGTAVLLRSLKKYTSVLNVDGR